MDAQAGGMLRGRTDWSDGVTSAHRTRLIDRIKREQLGALEMSSVYAGITVLVVILELAAFMSLFWKSVDKEPYRRWPRLQAPLRMLPGTRGGPG